MAKKSVVIRIEKEIRDMMKKTKKYPRETYSDVIKDALQELKRKRLK